MTLLKTNQPQALRYLFDESLYSVGMDTLITEKAALRNGEADQDTIQSVDFLGENQRRILYIIEETAYSFFSEAALDAFTKTILALGLSLDDVAVFNLATHPNSTFSRDQLVDLFHPEKIIFAGTPPLRLGFEGISLQVATQAAGMKILHTYSFEDMLQDVQKKKQFWQAIKLL